MRTTTLTLLLTTLLLTIAPSFFFSALVLAAPTPVAAATVPDVLVPKGATLNARSIPELLALKRANEKRGLDAVNGGAGEMLAGGWRRRSG